HLPDAEWALEELVELVEGAFGFRVVIHVTREEKSEVLDTNKEEREGDGGERLLGGVGRWVDSRDRPAGFWTIEDLVDGKVEGVVVKFGRPDFQQVLREIVIADGGVGDCGVVVSGPVSMVGSVKRAAAAESGESCLFHLEKLEMDHEVPPQYLPTSLQFAQYDQDTISLLVPGSRFAAFNIALDSSKISHPATASEQPKPTLETSIPSIVLTDSMDRQELLSMIPQDEEFTCNGVSKAIRIRSNHNDATICSFNLPSTGGSYQWRSSQELSLTRETTKVALTLYIESGEYEEEKESGGRIKRWFYNLHPGFVSDFSSVIAVARFESIVEPDAMKFSGTLRPFGDNENVHELPWNSREDVAMVIASATASIFALKYALYEAKWKEGNSKKK
ncbi:UNVERIFIED_CONTAM: hypothetical protein HDU68_002281, partial [Siphonaria sp. JEL0065]